MVVAGAYAGATPRTRAAMRTVALGVSMFGLMISVRFEAFTI